MSAIHFCQIDVNFCQTDANFCIEPLLRRKVNCGHPINGELEVEPKQINSYSDSDFCSSKTQIKSTIELPEDYQHFENYPVGKEKSFITSNQFSLRHFTFKAILEQYNI